MNVTTLPNQKSFDNILSTIGSTPLVRLDRLAPWSQVQLYGKLEAFNPGGSIKDRTAVQLITHAINAGELKPGDTVIESSSGNMAIGLAQVCLYHGLPLIVVTDPMVNMQTLKILKAYGAQIQQVTDPEQDGGFLSARLNMVKELLNTIPGSFWPNQYKNPQNPRTHRQTMHEIVEGIGGQLDYLFVATSTCGTLMGCADYIRENQLTTKLIAVDAEGSVIFGTPPGPRAIPGHGAGRRSEFLDQEKIHKVMHIDDAACVSGCRTLLEKEAMLCGGSSGAVVSAFQQYSEQLAHGATCALIFCDRGERYLDTIYNDQWVSEHVSSHPQVVA